LGGWLVGWLLVGDVQGCEKTLNMDGASRQGDLTSVEKDRQPGNYAQPVGGHQGFFINDILIEERALTTKSIYVLYRHVLFENLLHDIRSKQQTKKRQIYNDLPYV